jgi:cell division protein FtsL
MMTKPVRRKARSERVQGRRTYWSLVSVVGLFTLLGFAHAWTRLKVVERGYDIGRAQLENDKLNRQKKGLELELSSQQRVARVDLEAEKRLGMHKPGPDRRIILDTRPATASRDVAPTGQATR